MMMDRRLLATIQGAAGLVWLMSGIEKLSVPNDQFTASFVKTITFFASKNSYSFYKDYLLNSVLPQKVFFSYAIPWCEGLAGAVLILGAISLFFGLQNIYLKIAVLASLTGLVFMNINFWLAAGWTSPSTSSLNILLIVIEVVLIIKWSVNTENRLSSKA